MGNKGISRRNFLTGSAAVGALAAFGMTGCGPAKTSGKSGAGATEAAEGWAQGLNVDIASTLPGNTAEKVNVSDTKSCDVVVIGAGASGVNAAVRAAQGGLSVILVEKSGAIGGASLKSWAPSAPNSKYAKAAGSTVDTAPIIEKWVADSHWRVDASAVQQLVNNSGAAVDWMSENGWEFKYLGMGADITMLPDYDKREGLFRSMLAASVEKNGEVMEKTAAKYLLTNNEGAVTGVVVADESGKGTQIDAKAVVIATGGYGANAAMVKAAFGFEGVFAGLPQNVGEGLEMAWKAGAQKPQNFGGQMLHQTLARATDKLVGSFDAFPAKYPMILSYVANLMNVGATGQRFRNEALVLNAVPAANSSAYQGSFHYVIVSKDQMNKLETEGLAGLGISYSPGLPPEHKPAFEANTPWKGITDVFEQMVSDGTGFKGATFAELAEAAGMDVEIFEKQAKDYEGYCAAAADEQFGKPAMYLNAMGSGPYYAIIAEENNLCSWGGLLTNSDYQVLDEKRLPVPGLYAVGNEAGSNLFNDTYVGFGYGVGNAITSGYVCGGKLAEKLA